MENPDELEAKESHRVPLLHSGEGKEILPSDTSPAQIQEIKDNDQVSSFHEKEEKPVSAPENVKIEHERVEVDISLEVRHGERLIITLDPLSSSSPIEGNHEKASPAQVTAVIREQGTKHAKRQGPVLKKLQVIPYKEIVFFILALLVYDATRMIRLADFPIYYFCDEAINSILAMDFIRDDFRNYDGTLFPTYFKDGDGPYCLSTTVYIQVIPTMIFGKSVWMTRLLEVLLATMGAVWLSFMLRDIFKVWFWWAAPLFLAVVPVWFLHSRVSFGYSLMAAFYAGFLYYYLRYRQDKPFYIFPALACGAFSFYTYSAGPPILVLSGLLLLAIDFRYHLQHWRINWKAGLLLAALALPIIRFTITQTSEYGRWFDMYSSFFVQDGSWLHKAGEYLLRYLSGLNPLYWFFPNDHDLIMYTMKGYSNIPLWMLPLALYGLYLAIRQIKQPSSHIILVALLAAPSAAALVDVASRRILVIVIPVLIFTMLGLSDVMERINKKKTLSRVTQAYVMTIILGSAAFVMMNDAILNGPTWYRDYGLSGMQYGARQVYPAAIEYVEDHPELTLYISPNWTFQSEVIRQFFAPEEEAIRIGTTEQFLDEALPELDQAAFVLMPSEYQDVISSGKFKDISIDRILPYPDGQPGFYFVRLTYADNIEEILEAERQERARLQEGAVSLNGQSTTVRYSPLDMGTIDLVFDGNLASVIRTVEANPLIVELDFPSARQIDTVSVSVGAEKVKVTLVLTDTGQMQHTFLQEINPTAGNKQITFSIDPPISVASFHMEILDPDSPPRTNVHLWEIQLLP